MSDSQATLFAREWRVVAQYNGEITDDYIDEFGNPQQATILTGLSATVFERDGARYLAVRGTAGLADLLTDVVDIALLGTPERQLQYAALKDKVGEWLGNGTLSPGFTVSGHSLGGFLAGALLVDYPAQIGRAYLYNAPGAGGLSAALRRLLKLEQDPSLDLSRVTNLRAEGGGSMVAGLGLAWGPPIPIEIEVGLNPLHNHSIVTLADALAVYDLFGRLDGALDLSAIGDILKATSSRSEATLEAAIRALGKLFLATAPEVAVGDRDALYRAHDRIRAALPASGPTIVPLTALSAAELHAAAGNPDAFATRYALRELNPFAILGLDYSRFNENGELDLFDPAAGAGALTAEYLADRAGMLTWLMAGNRNDRGYGVAAGGLNVQYLDVADGRAAYALSTASALDAARAAGADAGRLAALFQAELARGTAGRVLFGGDDPEILNGGSQSDRLYGGAGDDRLEGGAGDDLLIGGPGHDTYVVGAGIGTDTIVDAAESDGRQAGEIRFGEAALVGTFAALDAERKTFSFTGGDGTYYADYTGSVQDGLPGTLTVWRGDSGARVVKVLNFRSGDLGIVLDTAAPARPYADITGTEEADNEALDVHMEHQATLRTTAAWQRVFGLGGADLIMLGHEHTIGHGGAGNDRIVGWAGGHLMYGEEGDDVLVAGAGNDELYGGEGNDALLGGAGDDLLHGGDGDDFIDGGIGADVIFGGAGDDFILGCGNLSYEFKVGFDYYRFATGAYAGLRFEDGVPHLPHLVGHDPWSTQSLDTGHAFLEGDLGDTIDAGDGNDWVFSGDGNDSVFGGAGADYLVGGAGDDYIDGGDDDDTILGDGTEGDMTQAPGAFWFYTYPQFHGNDVLRGGAGNDYIRGDGGDDLLFGDDGDDVLIGDASRLDGRFHGDDYLDGGAGNDLIMGVCGETHPPGYGAKSQSARDCGKTSANDTAWRAAA